ncbi:hypothetical protein IHQ71_31360 (plasmid) [Rhizobium sp. TH2]|uniref:WYL domain-containing protein n=1 Tax=Rhizobium sp. TH2 TaxID=2775403 RepID=UPI0021586FCF|nr:WYL domain-containing protein [Rhizobium sp. TH2]UVC12664.1 hypothetical protein IHQ71_31360 [Rhizobium sp. TH2]
MPTLVGKRLRLTIFNQGNCAPAIKVMIEIISQQPSLAKLLADIPCGYTLHIRYKEDDQYRVIHPHLAFDDRGKTMILARQIGGPDQDAGTSSWRQFRLRDITDVIFTDEKFDPHPDFNPGAKRYRTTILKVNVSEKGKK